MEEACPAKLSKKPLLLRRTQPPKHQPAISVVAHPPQRTRTWTPAEKLPAVVAASSHGATLPKAKNSGFRLKVHTVAPQTASYTAVPQTGSYAAVVPQTGFYAPTAGANSVLSHLEKAASHLASAGLHEEAAMVRERAVRTRAALNRETLRQKTVQLELLQKEIDQLRKQMLPRRVTVQAIIAKIPAEAFPAVKKKLEKHMQLRDQGKHGQYRLHAPATFKAAVEKMSAEGIRIVSQPVLIVQEGQPAECHVGQASPWIPVNHTQSGVIRQVALHHHGLNLEVKPVISASGKIELHSKLHVTALDENAPAGQHVQDVLEQSFQPVVANGETVAILTGPEKTSSRRGYNSAKGNCYLITLRPTLTAGN